MAPDNSSSFITNQNDLDSSRLYFFFLISKQAMMAGFYVVVAIHFSTAYLLISQKGFLAALSSVVVMVNALLCIVFYLWEIKYAERIKIICRHIQETGPENVLISKLSGNELKRRFNVSKVVIVSVSIGSLLFSAGLFILFTLPYLNKVL